LIAAECHSMCFIPRVITPNLSCYRRYLRQTSYLPASRQRYQN